LWAACQALWASVRTATPGVHYKEKLRPLKNEINAIAKVAGKLNDPKLKLNLSYIW